jgi:hypothetical protein
MNRHRREQQIETAHRGKHCKAQDQQGGREAGRRAGCGILSIKFPNGDRRHDHSPQPAGFAARELA